MATSITFAESISLADGATARLAISKIQGGKLHHLFAGDDLGNISCSFGVRSNEQGSIRRGIIHELWTACCLQIPDGHRVNPATLRRPVERGDGVVIGNTPAGTTNFRRTQESIFRNLQGLVATAVDGEFDHAADRAGFSGAVIDGS